MSSISETVTTVGDAITNTNGNSFFLARTEANDMGNTANNHQNNNLNFGGMYQKQYADMSMNIVNNCNGSNDNFNNIDERNMDVYMDNNHTNRTNNMEGFLDEEKSINYNIYNSEYKLNNIDNNCEKIAAAFMYQQNSPCLTEVVSCCAPATASVRASIPDSVPVATPTLGALAVGIGAESNTGGTVGCETYTNMQQIVAPTYTVPSITAPIASTATDTHSNDAGSIQVLGNNNSFSIVNMIKEHDQGTIAISHNPCVDLAANSNVDENGDSSTISDIDNNVSTLFTVEKYAMAINVPGVAGSVTSSFLTTDALNDIAAIQHVMNGYSVTEFNLPGGNNICIETCGRSENMAEIKLIATANYGGTELSKFFYPQSFNHIHIPSNSINFTNENKVHHFNLIRFATLFLIITLLAYYLSIIILRNRKKDVLFLLLIIIYHVSSLNDGFKPSFLLIIILYLIICNYNSFH